MSSFAKVENGKVSRVIVSDASFVSELTGYWIEVTASRKNPANIGYTYDPVRDAFYPPKPYNSWVLNEATCIWEAPIAYPTDGSSYLWDEPTGAWILDGFSGALG